jgi:hypothetical protein
MIANCVGLTVPNQGRLSRPLARGLGQNHPSCRFVDRCVTTKLRRADTARPSQERVRATPPRSMTSGWGSTRPRLVWSERGFPRPSGSDRHAAGGCPLPRTCPSSRTNHVELQRAQECHDRGDVPRGRGRSRRTPPRWRGGQLRRGHRAEYPGRGSCPGWADPAHRDPLPRGSGWAVCRPRVRTRTIARPGLCQAGGGPVRGAGRGARGAARGAGRSDGRKPGGARAGRAWGLCSWGCRGGRPGGAGGGRALRRRGARTSRALAHSGGAGGAGDGPGGARSPRGGHQYDLRRHPRPTVPVHPALGAGAPRACAHRGAGHPPVGAPRRQRPGARRARARGSARHGARDDARFAPRGRPR